MNRMEMIKALAAKSRGQAYVAPGRHLAETGEPSAIKVRKRCEWKRGGNCWTGNFGVSYKTPQEVAAGLPVDRPPEKVTFRASQRHEPHVLTRIAERLRRR